MSRTTAPPLPLVLTLHPLMPLRAPEHGCSTLTYGYQLRLPGGPALSDDDALLSAFGARVVALAAEDEHEEPFQHEAFGPGRRLTLMAAGVDDDGDPVVAVWDAEGVRRAGQLPYRRAAQVAAAFEQGLAVEAVVLTEERALLDARRVGLEILVHAPAMVRVEPGPEPTFAPPRPARERVVLRADGSGALRLWDPSGRGGPLQLGDLPVSDELADAFESLAAEYESAAERDAASGDGLDAFEREWARQALVSRTHELWRRARAELGQRYAIGLQGPGMSRPAWSPGDLSGDDAGIEIEF